MHKWFAWDCASGTSLACCVGGRGCELTIALQYVMVDASVVWLSVSVVFVQCVVPVSPRDLSRNYLREISHTQAHSHERRIKKDEKSRESWRREEEKRRKREREKERERRGQS